MAGEWTVQPLLRAATSDDPLAKTSLYVSELDPQVTDQDLIRIFRHFGPLHSVRVFRDLWSGDSLCNGFINFKSNSHASEALRVTNNTELKGKAMRVTWSKTNRSNLRVVNGEGEKLDSNKAEREDPLKQKQDDGLPLLLPLTYSGFSLPFRDSNKAEREDPLKQKQDETFGHYLQRYRAYVDTSMYRTNVDVPYVDVPMDCFEV